MSSLIAGRGKKAGKSFRSENAIASWKEIVGTMRKLPDVSGVSRHENNFQDAQSQAQKKISATVKIVRGYLGNQLFFCMPQLRDRRIERTKARSMSCNEFEEGNTRDGILEGVRHHSRPQALPQVGQYAEENSIDSDHSHHSRSLVAMTETEDRGGDDDPNNGILPDRAELALQVSTENDFFKESGANAQQDKESSLKICVGSDWAENSDRIISGFLQVMEIDGAQGDAEPSEQQESYNPKSKSDTHVQQERFYSLPATADQVTHADPAKMDPKPHQKDQHQLRYKRAAIKQDSRAVAAAADTLHFGGAEKGIAQDQCRDQQRMP